MKYYNLHNIKFECNYYIQKIKMKALIMIQYQVYHTQSEIANINKRV